MKVKLINPLICILPATLLAGNLDGNYSWAGFSEDGHSIAIVAGSINEFVGVSSVDYTYEERTTRLGINEYVLQGSVMESMCQTPFGEALMTRRTFGRKGSPFQYTIILKRLKSLQAFTLQGIFHNYSDVDVNLNSFDLLDTRLGSGGRFKVADASDWLVTPLMESTPAVSLADADKRYKEAAMLYRPDGKGFLVGPVGPAEAYTNVQFIEEAMIASVSMDGVLVRAGESRRSEEMIFCFEPVRTATDIWTRWVAATHGARLHRGPVYGWCSWYDRTTKIDEAHVIAVTETIGANPNVFGKGIIQIDDGYQKMDGDWSANEKFPSGMAGVAERIREAGCVPGVWFAPLMMHPEHPWSKAHPDAMQKNAQGISSFMNPNSFHPDGANWVNPSHPETKKFLYEIIKDARDRGYGYIKIDFNGIGSQFVDPTKTRMQVFRELYALYREAAGEDMYILSCLGSPTRGVVGFIDSARVGPDSHPAHFDKCLESVLRFQIYDNVWWQNDPDVAYIAEILPSRNLGPVRQGDGMWKTWLASVALTSGTAMISEPINMPDAREFWRNFEIMRPGSREPARLLTLGISPDNEIFGFVAKRPYGDFAVYNLYNSTGEPMAITLDFEAAGIPKGVECAVFDFWSNRLVGFARDTYTTDALDPLSSSLLRFTPIEHAKKELPILIGSNLHLSVGATEIDNLRINKSTVTIDLSDAGAQDGSLTFYSRQPIKAVDSGNCKIETVENLGSNLWRVNVSGRQWSKPQSIELAVGGQ